MLLHFPFIPPARLLVTTWLVAALLASALPVRAADDDAIDPPDSALDSGASLAEEPDPIASPNALDVVQPTAAPATSVSLFRFNPPASKQKILSRAAFYPLFMGIKETDKHATEAMMIRLMLQDPLVQIACHRLRKVWNRLPKRDAAARAKAMQSLAREIETFAASPDFSDRYLSYEGEGFEKDPDFLLYSTPDAALARFYGEVVLEIHERTPRGIDLNAYNRDVVGYYDHLKLSDHLNPSKLLIRKVLDRNEYVIPSHLESSEILAVVIHSQLPTPFRDRHVRLTGRVMRSYRLGQDGARRWVDLSDRNGLFLARFTLDPTVGLPSVPRSESELPADVLASIARVRIHGSRVAVLH